jgi:hypothetical protein
MKKWFPRKWLAVTLASTWIAAVLAADPPSVTQGKGADAASAAASQQNNDGTGSQGLEPREGPVRVNGIVGLCDASGKRVDLEFPNPQESQHPLVSDVGLNAVLWVVVTTTGETANAKPLDRQSCSGLVQTPPSTTSTAVQLDASEYALFFNGREVEGLEGTRYDSALHALGFQLRRNDKNKAVWTTLLGSPVPSRSVTVALGAYEKDKTTQPTIVGASDGKNATFQLQVFSPEWLSIAVLAILVVLALVFGTAKTSTTLRDTLLPQLPPTEQPFSLARCQMAFWFVLVFASFIFLYILLWDYNTVSSQAVALMGISSATALGSVAVDVIKDSPADAANRALQALGLNTYRDVTCVQQEIASRLAQVQKRQADRDSRKATAEQARADSNAALADASLAATAKAAAELADVADKDLKTLQAEIQDRQTIIRTYEDKSRPFRSESFFKDITTDLNGPTVHRLQVVLWTIALGATFLVGVYRDLAMPPDFSSTLLALMGFSGAAYVGFKYPEKNN